MSLITTFQSSCDSLTDVRHYLTHALADNTHRAYKNDFIHFQAWGGKIPSTSENVACYLTSYADTLAISTLQRRIISIGKAHKLQGYADPTKAELVKLTMQGIRRIHGKPQTRVSPILKEDLIVMLSAMPDTIKGKRDRALLLLGFCAALRRSELVAVKIEDLEFTLQGIVLTVPRSKTDQSGQGHKIGIPYGRGKICPVLAVKDWILQSGALKGHLFAPISKGGMIFEKQLSDRAVANIIKHYAQRAGLEASRYSGHSLRAGLCSSAAQHGMSSWIIRKQTGHKSDAMLSRYIREGSLFENNAASLF